MSSVALEELDTVATVFKKIEQNKLVVILFNIKYPDRGTIEYQLNWWRSDYESKYSVQFYKCVITIGENKFKKEFNIKELPTFIFFRNGKETGRLEDADELDVNSASSSVDTQDQLEQRFKQWLEKLCTVG